MTKFDLSQAVRPNILTLKPYRCARDDYSAGILLDANENTHGPSLPTPAEAVAEGSIGMSDEGPFKTAQLERYPDPHQVRTSCCNAQHLIPMLIGRGKEAIMQSPRPSLAFSFLSWSRV